MVLGAAPLDKSKVQHQTLPLQVVVVVDSIGSTAFVAGNIVEIVHNIEMHRIQVH